MSDNYWLSLAEKEQLEKDLLAHIKSKGATDPITVRTLVVDYLKKHNQTHHKVSVNITNGKVSVIVT